MIKQIIAVLLLANIVCLFNSIAQAATDTGGSRRLLIYKFGGAVTNKWDEKKFTLYGFEDRDRKKGSIPWEDTEENPRVLKWADPPNGVTKGAPKVLTFDGSTVAWGNGGAPHCFQYDESTCTFKNLYYRWGRTEKTATDNAGYTYSGTVYLVIQHSTGRGVLQKSSVSNSDTQTCIKIATVSDGKVTMDYTNMPVIPAYE